MELEEVLKKYKKPKKPMPLTNIIRVFIREGIENFYICRKEDVDVLIEGVDRLQKENEELKNIDLTTVYLKGVADEKERWRNNIRDLILKIDVDIERNKKHEIMYKEEMGISEYVCKMIAYMPETVKIILQNLLKEE